MSQFLGSESSFVISDGAASSENGDDVASLPSISSSILSDDDYEHSDAQREWEESLEQLQLLLTMVIMPFAGKFLGRKFAYWGWSRYMEWVHDVDIVWLNKGSFEIIGAVEVASSL
ncbi:hypothetical protein B0H67DRAFT_573470 [Lasiosphaeris hirsuta]|uniref:Uncharacterized protein n=1 Tax=Lasiosphaeris hirsuta TaxID=260670 RepID=A0AA40APE4_9PEZI|nr:hypothetical protein B0H67DRAFT_573470 [Lasiosphaeris hirsuta]